MKKEDIEKNEIVKLTLDFSLDIIEYCELLEGRKRYVMSNQLLKAGTGIGSNTWEAQNAESNYDFIHKFKIAAKEMDETQYWLLLCNYSESYPATDELLSKLETIEKIINKIIGTAKRRGTN